MSESIALPVIAPLKRQRRLPEWLKRRMPAAEALLRTRELINGLRLSTVCVAARCPNLTECWSRHTATFMILGDKCTRRCRFCAVTTARPDPLQADEPQRLAEAAAHLGLRHVVITSVARDDLKDEGAGHFARCIQAVRERLPTATVEVLVPDFHARRECVARVADAAPEVFNHNIETVESLQKRVRPQGKYGRSLETLRLAKEARPEVRTKSGIMVGLGETRAELIQTFQDLLAAGCQMLTIGQYLRPSREQTPGPQASASGAPTPPVTAERHVPVVRYYPPAEFDELAALAREMGLAAVASGPFVRSSYFAETLYRDT
jgi:lipoic acid synthetase